MRYTCCETSLGTIYVAWTDRGIACLSVGEGGEEEFRSYCRALAGQAPERDDSRRAELQKALQGWLEGEPYDGPVDLSPLSPFEREVLAACRAIPRGQVRTYAQLAAAVGRPRAARAVGNALRRNPVPLLIPCHRVVRSDGTLGEYSMGGPEMKRRLLALEGAR
nr:MAG: cysteine methyltransferase [Bacillota bacterium]